MTTVLKNPSLLENVPVFVCMCAFRLARTFNVGFFLFTCLKVPKKTTMYSPQLPWVRSWKMAHELGPPLMVLQGTRDVLARDDVSSGAQLGKDPLPAP